MREHHDRRALALKLTFVTCVSDDELLKLSLLASPCLAPGSRHEVILVRNACSAADGLNLGIERAVGELIVCIHQDVFLPEGWDDRLIQQFAMAERELGDIGVAGVYGVGPAVPHQGELGAQRIGRVCDRGRSLDEGIPLPARGATLDELLLVVPNGTPLKVEPNLGFHLYGADLCLQAAERARAVAVLDAYCHHNSRNIGLPREFFASAEAFAHKWHQCLPVATPCVIIDETGLVRILGNTTTQGLAQAR